MTNKSPLNFCAFFLLFSFSLIVNAQDQKINSDFTIDVIKYSDKPNFEKDHLYILELKNNSNSTSEYSISLNNNLCSENNHNKSVSEKESNIISEIYFNNLSIKHQLADIISLKPYEVKTIYLKTQQKGSALLGSWNCTSIEATKLSKSKSKGSKKNISESITIKTFIPDPTNPGH